MAESGTRLGRAKELFADALDRPEVERRDFVSRACADDAELGAMVADLLKAHGQAARFMHAASAPTIPMPPQESAGARIGHYKLLQQIGEGGFGLVFMAEQEQPVRRRVALKVIKVGMD